MFAGIGDWLFAIDLTAPVSPFPVWKISCDFLLG
jgi:hypothetical protein